MLRLGTRKSPLALAQARLVARRLEALHPGLEVALVALETRGDLTPGDLAPLGGKGLFTEELERGLLAGELDLAVHSLKDLPVTLPAGLEIVAYPERADPRDALVSQLAASLEALPRGATVLTGSLRRRAQILHHRPDLTIEAIRGNVGTRLEKWRSSGAAAMVLALAGLERLGIADVPVHPLDPAVCVPAPGQATLAVEVAAGSAAARLCQALDEPRVRDAALAERTLVAEMGGDCTLPLGAWAEPLAGGQLRLVALLALPDGSRVARAEAVRSHPVAAAEACWVELIQAGADEILAELAG